MKAHLLALLSMAFVPLSNAAAAHAADTLQALSFTQRNSQAIQSLVSNSGDCAALVRSAVALHTARASPSNDKPVLAVRVADACRVASLNGDGKLQVLCMADLYEGNGPLSYVAVFKHSGFLDMSELAVGEGNGNLGPVSLSLEDIDHDGRLEIVSEERHVDLDGHIGAMTDPAATVTYIYV